MGLLLIIYTLFSIYLANPYEHNWRLDDYSIKTKKVFVTCMEFNEDGMIYIVLEKLCVISLEIRKRQNSVEKIILYKFI